MCFSNSVYARYIKLDTLVVKQEIARPVIEIENGTVLKIDNENKIGYYNLSVKNFTDKYVSDVDLFYRIIIIVDSKVEKNVELNLYKENEDIKLSDLKTEEIFIKGKVKNEQKYRLKINYNNVEGGENIRGKIQIKIDAEQEKYNVNK